MTEAVRQFVEHASRPITARTLHNNVASRKILLRNEFTETSRDDTWIHYQMGC
jgi:RimJ/RimL family protein N-acetyltransferase